MTGVREYQRLLAQANARAEAAERRADEWENRYNTAWTDMRRIVALGPEAERDEALAQVRGLQDRLDAAQAELDAIVEGHVKAGPGPEHEFFCSKCGRGYGYHRWPCLTAEIVERVRRALGVGENREPLLCVNCGKPMVEHGPMANCSARPDTARLLHPEPGVGENPPRAALRKSYDDRGKSTLTNEVGPSERTPGETT